MPKKIAISMTSGGIAVIDATDVVINGEVFALCHSVATEPVIPAGQTMLSAPVVEKEWRVCDYETGLSLGFSRKREEAIKIAEGRLGVYNLAYARERALLGQWGLL
mgnify:FL=1